MLSQYPSKKNNLNMVAVNKNIIYNMPEHLFNTAFVVVTSGTKEQIF